MYDETTKRRIGVRAKEKVRKQSNSVARESKQSFKQRSPRKCCGAIDVPATDKTPNAETAAAIREIRNGGGIRFNSREEYFKWLDS